VWLATEGKLAHFFLSYARGDDDEYVQKFFTDVSRELRRRGVQDEPAGFLDTNMDVGTEWESELQEALCSCRVFIAIYSPRYFSREHCGKEWQVFNERMRRYEEQTGDRPQTLLPILWVPPAQELPEEARRIQYLAGELGPAYAENGLFRILKVKKFEDEYDLFLAKLVDRMIERARQFPLPRAPRVSMAEVPNAFAWNAPKPQVSTPPPTPAEAPVRGSRQVHFMFAVSRQEDLPEHRRRRQFYGDYPADWRPYLPDYAEPLSLLAQTSTATRKFTSDLLSVDENLFVRLDEARQHNQIVVLLIDPWAGESRRFQELLSRYDNANEPTSGVLVPMSRTDDETLQQRPLLTETLRGLFARNVVRNDSMFRLGIGDAEAFETALSEILIEAQNRVFSFGEVRKRPPGDVQRPILSGP
jgi:FxsC-like protein